MPFGLVDELLARLADDGSRPAEDEVWGVAQTLEQVLRDAADRGPTAVFIDDLHDVDPISRTTLSLALRRLQDAAVLVVLAGRPTETVLEFTDGLRVIELPGLESAAANELLATTVEGHINPRVAEVLIHSAVGNPLALIYLAQGLSEDELTGRTLLPDPLPLSGHLQAIVSRPLEAVEGEVLDLLRLAATSTDGSWQVVRAAVGSAADELLTQAERHGLAGLQDRSVEFSHPLLRSAVLADLSPDEQRDLHARLARVPGLSDHARLVHQAGATMGTDAGIAEQAALEADRLERRGAPGEAGRLWLMAARLVAEPALVDRWTLRACRNLASGGSVAAAIQRLRTLVGETIDDELRSEASLTLGILETLNGAPFDSLQRLQDAARVERRADVRSQIHAGMAMPLGMLGMTRQIQEEAQVALDLAPEDSPIATMAAATLAHASLAIREGHGESLLEKILPELDVEQVIAIDPMIGLHIGRPLGLTERFDDADRVMADLRAVSRGRYGGPTLAMTLGAMAEIQLRACRWTEGVRTASEAIALSLSTGQRAFAPFWLAIRCRLHALQGRQPDAEADLELGLVIAEELSLVGARYFLSAAAGTVRRVGEDTAGAVEAMEECRLFEELGGTLAPTLGRWAPELIELHHADGRDDDAAAICTWLEAEAARPGATRWTVGVAARSQAILSTDPSLARRHVDRATQVLDPVVDAFDRARAMQRSAQLYDAAGEADLAERDAREARLALGQLGAEGWLRLTSAEATPDPFDLTDAERQVMLLLATGKSNREIASALHLSPKTIANHLYRIYPKLDVRSRTEAISVFTAR